MNMFAAKHSGVASMIESLIPKEIMDSIKQVTGQLPVILETVQRKVESIEAAQVRIESNQNNILAAIDELRCKIDPDSTSRIRGVSENLKRLLDGNDFVTVPERVENAGIGNGSD